MSNVICDHPYSGMEFVNFNDVRMAHNRSYRFFGQQGNLLALKSDATSASCCFDGTDFYGHTNATLGDLGTGETGYLIDGQVDTVIARNFDLSDIAGSGMAVSNVVGAAHNPQFIQFTDFGAEYMTGRGVDLEAGRKSASAARAFSTPPATAISSPALPPPIFMWRAASPLGAGSAAGSITPRATMSISTRRKGRSGRNR